MNDVSRLGLGWTHLEPNSWPKTWSTAAAGRFCFQTDPSLPVLGVHYLGVCSFQAPIGLATVTADSTSFHFLASGVQGTLLPQERVLQVSATTASPKWSTLENALRISVSLLLPMEHEGLMLHAASCISGGNGIVIAGLSGAGKSTFANGLVEATYLTDDITLIDRLSSAPRLLPTPFYGSLGRMGADSTADLHVIGILRQAEHETVITPLRRAEAASALLRHVVAFSSESRLVGAILDRVVATVSRVPVFDVARSLADSSDELCRKLLEAAESVR